MHIENKLGKLNTLEDMGIPGSGLFTKRILRRHQRQKQSDIQTFRLS